ncbi:MAG: ribulose-1,5-bisphosphate carboxylase/oxygenase large subunit [Candidatus Methanoperedens nitroreducens]|uniref:Ribulose bisphosphate carboxylase n=1 Tax=Candidatus Methanoperedens nitratireducens TaxID=1392998 RepID=A0A0N8KRM6_9EURY|nr:type III ribulose-bisphosphate carboxylase [Candidatus Methanoperedens sp. BLZ2]KAB2945494.1 MAG: type III ribulose-bisphosphate carboxylase [Candidatus Methanoperedens sp.]KPQ45362.1 MAG: ribulose-1,5-bisphosphate carboxylase/oxygenase large subunit [Candidatus Methanoperedens sp. BLZ1]MBZ0174742.1 type III ribulose-bisphosphate carboxylase [Candidatus Methanoperedens nitroreducens]MCX9080087.1 type III ribulose-bisphosphate carboxylase [Candidatus Methanoperedens sp.]
MTAKIDWYNEFVDFNYTPAKDDLICLYYFEPAKGITEKEAIGRIASESSAGTWTTLHDLPPRVEKIKARAFELNGKYVKIAYPIDLWEPGNAPQLLSGIAGNIFGMKALRNLRLIDLSFPRQYIKSFKGPGQGIEGIRSLLKIKERPITGAVPKPKIGFSAAEHADVAYETWMGGFDLVKDDENLTSTSFNRFEDRLMRMAKLRDKAEKETGEEKDALLNITGETKEMIRKAKLLHDSGWRFAMIDVVTCGTASVQTMRDECGDLGLAIHAHRAMHAAFDRNPRHGLSMYFLAKLMRLIGVDEIHSGTAIGKLVGSKKEVTQIARVLRDYKIEDGDMLSQDWGSIKPALPVSSGGLHPGLIPSVMSILGNDCTLLVSGGIHGHPEGTRAGAKAVMQAIEASMDGTDLNEFAIKNKELKQALGKWEYYRPK